MIVITVSSISSLFFPANLPVVIYLKLVINNLKNWTVSPTVYIPAIILVTYNIIAAAYEWRYCSA